MSDELKKLKELNTYLEAYNKRLGIVVQMEREQKQLAKQGKEELLRLFGRKKNGSQ